MAGDRDGDELAALAALVVRAALELVESLLGLPGECDHRWFLALLAAGELGAQPRVWR